MTTGPSNEDFRVEFVIVGAMKAGTTSLFHYMKDHPHIQMAGGKELHFFSSPERWERGWDWYEDQFPAREPATVAMGEASVSYTMHPQFPEVPARLASRFPDAKLIYLVREPIARMRSQYLHRVRSGEERRGIDEALLSDPRYLDPSRYAMQVRHLLEHFPQEQLLVRTSTALKEDRAQTLAEVFAFLGVDTAWRSPAADREFNRSEVRTEGVRPGAAKMVRNPTVRRLSRLAPRWLRRSVKRPVDPDVRIAPGTEAELRERLAPDAAEIGRWLPEGFDGWGLT